MKIDVNVPVCGGQPNFKKVRVQKCRSVKARISSLGSDIKRGDKIFHFCSDRGTGEVFVFTPNDLAQILALDTTKFNSLRRKLHT